MKKINLHCGEQTRSDCINIDIRPEFRDCSAQDEYCLNFNEGSCSEIIVNPGCLESIPKEDIARILLTWKNSLKAGGSLWVNFADVRPMFNKVSYERMPLSELEGFVCQTRSMWDMDSVRSLLPAGGFSIHSSNYTDFIGTVHAIKE
jgi:hypothetical protein